MLTKKLLENRTDTFPIEEMGMGPVFHASNPTVPAIILDNETQRIRPTAHRLYFAEKITMPGNPNREPSREWITSKCHTYPSSELAQAAHLAYILLRSR